MSYPDRKFADNDPRSLFIGLALLAVSDLMYLLLFLPLPRQIMEDIEEVLFGTANPIMWVPAVAGLFLSIWGTSRLRRLFAAAGIAVMNAGTFWASMCAITWEMDHGHDVGSFGGFMAELILVLWVLIGLGIVIAGLMWRATFPSSRANDRKP